MATQTVTIPLDEVLVQRVRRAELTASSRNDAEAVERALAIYLGDRAVESAQAAGPLAEDDALQLAASELRAVRHQAA